MRSIILSIISLFICVNCYAAPAFLDNLSDRLDPVIYLGEARFDDGKGNVENVSVFTTAYSVDIMLNTFQYNHKDWNLYILMEYRGQYRKIAIDQAMKYNTQWVNTRSGSRVFWALGKKFLTKNNTLGIYGPDEFFNDEGEFMGSLDVTNQDFDLTKYSSNIGMKAVNQLVINYLDKEYQRRYGRDNGQPIQ